MRAGLTLAATVVGALSQVVLLGCAPSPGGPSGPTLHLLASVDVPLSASQDVALVREDTGCLVESYANRVHCVRWDGRMAGVFGREGEGPGEFSDLVMVARGPGGNVAVADMALGRLTVFSVDGAVLAETRLPRGFLSVQISDDGIVGSLLDETSDSESTRGSSVFPPTIPVELDVRTGEVLWSRKDMTDAASVDCLMLGEVAMSPTGGLVVRDCSRRGLAFFDDRDGEGTVVGSPVHVEELPNERDVEAYLAGMARLGGGGEGAASAAWTDARSARFRATPKAWYRGPFRFDGQGQTWVATSRDRDDYSYFEIWANARYVGTARVRDRLIGYDILGATLVALVERKPNRDGIAQRALDWYDIGRPAEARRLPPAPLPGQIQRQAVVSPPTRTDRHALR